jgi:YgiT-type zinc finger domain-containing protein
MPNVRCSLVGCTGHCEPRLIVHTVRHHGEIVVIDHVPAEVCSVCGDVLLAPATIRRIERLLQHRAAPASAAALYEYA